MRITIEELQNGTINGLNNIKNDYQQRIEELTHEIEDMKMNIVDIDNMLEQKQRIETHNIVEVIKSKFWMSGSETEIEIYVKSVADNNEKQMLNDVAFRRLKYSDRTMLYDILETLNKEYGFTKIVCNTMKMTKKICETYDVVESL